MELLLIVIVLLLLFGGGLSLMPAERAVCRARATVKNEHRR
jgi:Sec-independent protein translocase protein TatA